MSANLHPEMIPPRTLFGETDANRLDRRGLIGRERSEEREHVEQMDRRFRFWNGNSTVLA